VVEERSPRAAGRQESGGSMSVQLCPLCAEAIIGIAGDHYRECVVLNGITPLAPTPDSGADLAGGDPTAPATAAKSAARSTDLSPQEER
jgi:hypothetical protein